QSSNEELETTNEELQSTVEELETTNEELQSSNEELETMNEELESTNAELQSINTDLRIRTEEVNKLNTFLRAITGIIDVGAAVLDAGSKIQVWNERAADLWGMRSDEVLQRRNSGGSLVARREGQLHHSTAQLLCQGGAHVDQAAVRDEPVLGVLGRAPGEDDAPIGVLGGIGLASQHVDTPACFLVG